MKLLFTKGVKGYLEKNQIHLSTYNSNLCTGYYYTEEGVKSLEEEYNIKLIGMSSIDGDGDEYEFIILDEENKFLNIEDILFTLENKFIDLEELISSYIMKDEDFEKIKKLTPIFLTTEGIVPDLFFKKEDFQNGLTRSPLIKLFNSKEVSKIIYNYDILSITRSIENYIISFSRAFLHASNKLNDTLLKNIKFCMNSICTNDPIEYKSMGKYSIDITSLYSNIIIQMCSALDLTSKLICEICHLPCDFSKNIKFESGNIYFKDISRYINKFNKYEGFENSFINNKKSYNDLIIIRNNIVHNAFFTNDESLFWGFKTKVVNNKPINYIVSYVWDVDAEGKPERWLNRFRFYGQSRDTQEYLINYFFKFYNHMSSTLDIIIKYISEL